MQVEALSCWCEMKDALESHGLGKWVHLGWDTPGQLQQLCQETIALCSLIGQYVGNRVCPVYDFPRACSLVFIGRYGLCSCCKCTVSDTSSMGYVLVGAIHAEALASCIMSMPANSLIGIWAFICFAFCISQYDSFFPSACHVDWSGFKSFWFGFGWR